MRFRTFMVRRLPALLEGLARSWIESLGLTAVPVEVSDVDAFGMSQEFIERWQPVLARSLSNTLRPELRGLEKLPAEGPALLVCNHSRLLPGVLPSGLVSPGTVPYDELLLEIAVREARPSSSGRDIRPLCGDFAINAPFAGSFLNRFGLVRRSPDNAERLLRGGQIVADFQDGFVELARRVDAPIHPVALGPISLLPLPSRWNLQVGDAIRAKTNPAATEEVRQRMQGMLAALSDPRQSVFP